MSGAYGEGPLAFSRLFEKLLDGLPWFAAAVGIVVLIWIAMSWRDS